MSIWAKGSQNDVQPSAMEDAACHKGAEGLAHRSRREPACQGNQMDVPKPLELLLGSQSRKMRN